MCRRPLFFPCAVLLLAGLAALPACKKKATDTGSGGDTPAPGPTGAPSASGSSDYILFAHLKAKDILDSDLFAEIKQAVAKAGASADWDKFEKDASKDLGVKPTDIDSVTIYVTEIPKNNKAPKFVAILAANKPIDKGNVLKQGAQAKPDSRGFYEARDKDAGLIHFPDAKTMVVLHADLAQKYLDGYAKSRTGWPMTAELTKVASEHTLYADIRVNKFSDDLKRNMPVQNIPQAEALLATKRVAVSADLNGKEVQFSALATFPSPAAAEKAKASVKELLGMAPGLIDVFAGGKDAKQFTAFMPAIQEAKRMMKDLQVEVEGSDLVVNGSYNANFDIGTMVVEAVKLIRKSNGEMTANNNLKQIGLGLHNHYSATGGPLLIHAITTKGQPLKNATDKPLLSWRVALLPYIEQENLYGQFKLDEPWDSPNNKKLIEQMPKIYASENKAGKPGYTHLQMVIGPNATQPGMQFASFTDGLSNTIAVVEAAEPVIWTKPDDVMLPGNVLPKDFRKKFGGLQPGGFNVLMWDGSTRFVRDSVSDQVLSLLLNPRDGQVIPAGW